MRKLMVGAVALVAALAFTVSGAFGGAEQTPGVTAKSIVIGGTFPLTGPPRRVRDDPVGMKAYFSYINARRGRTESAASYGRQIVWKYYDDGYNPREHGAAHARARRAGQGVRRRSGSSGPSTTSRSGRT